MRVASAERKHVSGFTLVEMAIVLVIIGIILAGVMKGRDIVRSAQMKEFAQSFGNKWVTLTQTYYDKTGQHLGDGSANGVIGGGNPDGYIDGMGATDAGAAGDDYDYLMATLQSVGVDPCNNIKTINTSAIPAFSATYAQACQGAKNPFVYSGDSEELGQVDMYVNWGCIDDQTDDRIKNVVSFTNVPIEFAKAMDTLVDGEARGDLGFCLYGGNVAAFDAASALDSIFLNQAGTIDFTPAAWPLYGAGSEVVEVVIAMDY